MKIIIVGGGVVGYALAEHLERENHSVSLIEKDTAICENINERLDARVICGTGSSPRLLEAAGISSADMIIAVSPIDEINIMVCAIAKQYGVNTRIARIRSNEFRGADSSVDIAALGVTLVIDPESVVVDSIAQFVETPGAFEAVNFQKGNVLMRGYKVTENMPIANMPITDIKKEAESLAMLFIAAVRDGEGFIPDGQYVVKPGDELFGIFSRDTIETYLGFFGKTRKAVDNVIISSDNLTGILLAGELQKFVSHVTLVDSNADHARLAAETLNNVEVINGDCTESAILKELYVRNAQFFIATAKETEFNVMSALLAKAEGAREVIAVSNEVRHDELFTSIGIDHVIHPRLAIAREILEAINRGQIGRIAKISNLDIEAIRITAEEGSPITGRAISQLRNKLQKGTIIGAIFRGEDMLIPDGKTIIEPFDKMILISYTKNIPRIKKQFKTR
ncbi:MAG: Trk system potassium transporter TrkA [Candidatus Zixiibacteriota bacterium]